MNDLKGIRLNARCWWPLSRAPRGTSTALRAEPSRPSGPLQCAEEGHWAKGALTLVLRQALVHAAARKVTGKSTVTHP